MIRSTCMGFIILCFLAPWAVADSPKAGPSAIKVGLAIEPPFVLKVGDDWGGISIELWEVIAKKNGWSWTYSQYELPDLLARVQSGEVDIAVGPIARTAEREAVMDFSPSYLSSGLAIASRRTPVSSVLDVLSHLGDSAFMQLTLSLLIICLLFGLLMWWAERRQNKDHFGGQMVHGFGSGIWWSMVTMSTVGYGDKAPRTMLGRSVGLVWIFLSIVLLAAFTGTIASSMTMGRMGNQITSLGGLRSHRVGTLLKSEASRWLERNHVATKGFNSLLLGLEAVADHKIDVFVGDRAGITWQLSRWDRGPDLVVQGDLHPERLAFAVNNKSPYRDQLDVSMLSVLESPTWSELKSQFGEQEILLNSRQGVVK